MNTLGFLGAFALILVIIPMGSAIKCYQCQSKNDEVCGSEDLPANPAPNHPAYKFFVDCSGQGPDSKNTVDPQFRGNEYTFCRKQVQEVEEKKNIIRACGLVKGDKDCYTTANPPTKTLVCQCFEDGCNGASSLTFSVALSSMLLIMLIFCPINA